MESQMYCLVLVVIVACAAISPSFADAVEGGAVYDYVIVGGGTAGSVLAARLSANPNVSVLLLEAGSATVTTPNSEVVGLTVDHGSTGAVWQHESVPLTTSHLASQGQVSVSASGRVLGGSSVTSGLQYVRGFPEDYDTWAADGCDGWGFKDVRSYFLKKTAYNSADVLDVSEVCPSTMLCSVFLYAGNEIGFRSRKQVVNDFVGFGPFYGAFKKGERSSASKNYLKPAMVRSNLHVVSNALVTKILFDQNTAKGVRVVKDGKTMTVACRREVLVSAGTMGSAKLLLLSGVGPKDQLRGLDIPVVAELPVGENLQDHLLLPVWADTIYPGYTRGPFGIWEWVKYMFGAGALAETEYSGTAFVNVTSAGRPDIKINFAPHKFQYQQLGLNAKEELVTELNEASGGPGLTFTLSLLHPKSRGRVQLSSSDPAAPLQIDPGYLQDPDDVATLAKAVEIVEFLLNTNAMEFLHSTMLGKSFDFCIKNGHPNTQEYWKCVIRHIAVSSNQLVGTCKMGARGDPASVVDPQLRVVGTKRLRVVDSAIIPTITSGTVNAATIMIAEKAAESILKECTVKT